MSVLPKNPMKLLETLLHADTEEEVITALKAEGLWDNPALWRHYGDKESNYSQIGGQQSQPESSLTEKLTNSIDALLLGECRARGIDPEGPIAPQTMAEAVTFFFGAQSDFGPGNTLVDWDNKKRNEISRRLTIAVTGSKQLPSITISDLGEGQRPDEVPQTFVSLDRQNKARIHFVQGKFNMGGSGVLRFCGRENIQLIVSKRDPRVTKALSEKYEDSDLWGFTVVRRESTDGRSSTYTYLAPLGATIKPRRGGILRFAAAQLKMMPLKQDPYGTSMKHGSVIKLYEYDAKGFAGNAIRKDGLRERLEAKLPEPALPVRIHECRAFRGHKGSFETYVYGATTRLASNRDNLEEGFPDSVQFAIAGERLSARIYAFKPQKLKTYFSNEGVILMVNGQTHATIPQTFFVRKGVKMDRLAGSLLLMIDCTSLSQRAREDLFMTSRDRLSGNALSKQLQEQLSEVVSHHHGLRELAERRKREEIEERLKDDQPLEKILERLLRASPALEKLLPAGLRLPSSVRSGGSTNDGTGEGGRGDAPFVGKPHPTFFRFEKRSYGQNLLRRFEVGRRCRLRLETDAVNDYLTREQQPGFFDVSFAEESTTALPTWSVTLHNGVAQVSLDFGDSVKVGDEIVLALTVNDDTLAQPFVNVVRLTVDEQHDHSPGTTTERNGSRSRGRNEEGPGGLTLPRILKVHKEHWELRNFDQHSAATIIRDAEQLEVHVNVDNGHLKQFQRASKDDPRLPEARFVFGNVLITLAVYQRFLELEKLADSNGTGEDISKLVSLGPQRLVEEMSRATAPFLLPMIDRLGALADEDIEAVASISDED